MSLSDFWPTERNVLECIKPEAENPRDEVFLAIHQPMQFEKRHLKNNSKSPATEQDLLKALLSNDIPTGTLLLPIVGASGIGKSHIVRWLDVQLRQRKDGKKRHLIRLPKSSSLKNVLRRILDGLKGEQYNQIRKELDSAREKLTGIQSEELVFSHLVIAVRTRVDDAKRRKAKAKENGERPDPEDERWIAVGDDRKLPSILQDPEARKLFLSTKQRHGIVTELSRRLTEDSESDEVPRNRFEPADFEIPDVLQTDIGRAGEYARNYLRSLSRSDGRARADAIELINAIVDEAIAPLASPSDNSLSDIFYEIRRELLKEKRELVLLVEDFAVLAGIQGALLDAMVKEGIRDGEQEICTLRTALAVTEGYLKDFDTVETRAHHAWHILESPNEEETQTIARICSFTGAYLNGARFGAAELGTRLPNDATDQSWVPNFKDEASLTSDESTQLQAFGTCEHGRSLFPFSVNAIRQIANAKMRDGDGKLMFKPRTIIRDMLIPVLKDHRSEYIWGSFPPAAPFLGYGVDEIDPELRSQINERQRDAMIQKRLYAIVRFWGDNPDRLEELSVPAGIYQAFQLPELSTGSLPSTPPSVNPSKTANDFIGGAIEPIPTRPALPQPAKTPRIPEEIQKWFDLFGKWAGGQSLPQREANNLRTEILELVSSAVDWDAELLSEDIPKSAQEWVYLPLSRGAPNCDRENACIVVATDQEFTGNDLPVVNLLRAIVRHRFHKGWNYEEADEDFSRLANFIDHARPRLTKWLRNNYRNVKGDPSSVLTQTLLLGSRILNIENSHAQEDASLINAVFAQVKTDFESGDTPWEMLRFKSQENRGRVRTELMVRVCARQGSSDKVYAVDAASILENIKLLKSEWKVDQGLDKSADKEIPEIASHVKAISKDLDKAASKRRKQILDEWKKVEDQIGTSPNKSALIEEAQRLIETGKQRGFKPPVGSTADLSRLVESFRGAAVKTCLEHVTKIQAEADGGSLLSALAQFDDPTLSLLIDFTVQIGVYSADLISKSDGMLRVLGDDIVSSAVQDFEQRLDTIEIAILKPKGVIQ